MGIEVFLISDLVKDDMFRFVEDFLNSSDFDQVLRRKIAHELDIPVGEFDTKLQVAEEISEAIRRQQTGSAKAIINAMIERKRPYLSIKLGSVGSNPSLGDVRELALAPGEAKWYGPVQHSYDEDTVWYIRPVFINYEISERYEDQNTTKEYVARWLIFARVTKTSISLHWRGFTSGKGIFFIDNEPFKGQFPYWRYIPDLFNEIVEKTHSNMNEINLNALILDTLWERYRYDYETYIWKDVRIRAEHRGISLNASAGAITRTEYNNEQNENDEDIDDEDDATGVEGIEYLAITIRKSVWQRLKTSNYTPPEDIQTIKQIEDEILRTLIKKYDPKSYECIIREKIGESILFNGYSFFGSRPQSLSPDGFTHIRLRRVTKLGDLEQMQFLLNHINSNEHVVKNVDTNIPFRQDRLL